MNHKSKSEYNCIARSNRGHMRRTFSKISDKDRIPRIFCDSE